MPNAKTVDELLTQAEKQQNEHVALSQAVQLLADVHFLACEATGATANKGTGAQEPPRASRRCKHEDVPLKVLAEHGLNETGASLAA
jgi:hypothetical protein